MQRVRAWALEQPQRANDERARLWDGMAYRAFRLGQWDEAVEASEHSAKLAPHEGALMKLAIARTYAHDYVGAESVYVRLAERFPSDPLVWLGLGGVALRLGDSLRYERAVSNLQRYGPGSQEARAIRRHLQIFPAVW